MKRTDGSITKAGGICIDGIMVPSSELNPVIFRQAGINYLIFDCKDSVITKKSLEDIAIYLPGHDLGQKNVGVVYIENNTIHSCQLSIEDSFLNELIQSAKEAEESKKSDYLDIIGMENDFYIRNNNPETPVTQSFPADRNDNFSDLGNYKGAITEFSTADALTDSSVAYFDGMNPVSFDDNPIINIIPKYYFKNITDQIVIGTEYGFYISTIATSDKNKNLSHFIVFSTTHSIDKCNKIWTVSDNNNPVVAFELKPIIQGTCDYYYNIDTVCHFIETTNLCIDNPTYTYSFNNANGRFNDPDNWYKKEDEKGNNYGSCSIMYRFAFDGKTKFSQNYTPVFSQLKSVTAYLKKLPIPEDTYVGIAIAVSDYIASILEQGYEKFQNNFDNYEKETYCNLEFKRDRKTNQISASSLFSYRGGYSDILNKIYAGKLEKAFKGGVFSLDNYNGKYDDDYPILLKDNKDSFKFSFELHSYDDYNSFAQDILDKITFNIKRDDTKKAFGKVQLLKTKDSFYRAWRMFYDPCFEYEKKTIALELGKEYLTTFGNEDDTENEKSVFDFSPSLSGNYDFINYHATTNTSITILDANGQSVQTTTLMSNNDTLKIRAELEAGKSYKIYVSGSANNVGYCTFKGYYSLSQLYQQSGTSPSGVAYADAPITYLYSFTPHYLDKERQNFLFMTSERTAGECPDTEIILMNNKMDVICSSDDINASGNTRTTSGLVCTLYTEKEYYIALTMKNVPDTRIGTYISALPCQRISPLDEDMIINYPFYLDYDSKAFAFLLSTQSAGKYSFRVFGNDVSHDIGSTLFRFPMERMTSAFVPGKEPIIQTQLNSATDYLLIVNHYFPYRQVSSSLQLNYWRNL